jgi:hypothetical protein
MPETSSYTARGSGTYTPPPPITLEVSPEMMATLQGLANKSGQRLDVIFTKAIALYQAALQAADQGKHVGYTGSPDALDVEFTGFTGPEER